jgi:putative glutamine amidotransferase
MDNQPLIASAWLKPDYRASVEAVGGRLKELTPADALPAALDGCHGLLLTGGPDVDPQEYGDAERHATVEVDAERDRYELALARDAMARNMPVLAICRGAQVLNAAAGGTLMQDIPSAVPGALNHQHVESKTALVHEVTVQPRTTLWSVLSPRLDARHQIPVNSRHHQSVKAVAPGFVVSAVAPDGVIEGIEKPDAPFCVGVQWHPENFVVSGDFRGLFEGFVAAARRYR